MRTILFDNVYDTDTAEFIAEREMDFAFTAYDHVKQKLYKNKSGIYFVVGYTAFGECEMYPLMSHEMSEWANAIERAKSKTTKTVQLKLF